MPCFLKNIDQYISCIPLTVFNQVVFLKESQTSFYMTVALVDFILDIETIETEYLWTVFTVPFSNLDVQGNVLIFGFTTFQCATSFL